MTCIDAYHTISTKTMLNFNPLDELADINNMTDLLVLKASMEEELAIMKSRLPFTLVMSARARGMTVEKYHAAQVGGIQLVLDSIAKKALTLGG